MLKHLLLAASLLLFTIAATPPAAPSYQLAKLHYGGGGDWYANKTSLPNLIGFCNQALHTNQEAVMQAYHGFWKGYCMLQMPFKTLMYT